MSDTAFLYIESLQCIRQRDFPLDGDTPYLLLFTGQPDTPQGSNVMRITNSQWDDSVHSGDELHPRTWIHHDVRHDTVVMIALLEQNWRHDLDDESLNALRESMQSRWTHITRSGATADSMAHAAHNSFRKQIAHLLHNDKLIQVRHLPLAHHGSLPAVSFAGHGALYRARFRLQPI